MAKRNRKPRGLPPDPDAGWDKPDLAYEEGLDLCDRILEKLEDDVADYKYNAGFDFFNSVEEKVRSIRETIERSKRYSEGQKSALESMESGVDKWIDR